MKKFKMIVLAFLLVPVLLLATACGGVAIPDWANSNPETAEEFVTILKEKGYENAALAGTVITGTRTEEEKEYFVMVQVYADENTAAMSFYMAKGMVQGVIEYMDQVKVDDLEDDEREEIEAFKALNFSFGSDNFTVEGTYEEEEMSMFIKLSGKYFIMGGIGDSSFLSGIIS